MFNKIIAKNFLSWSDLEFDFKSGVTLISGFNYDDNTAEGSGKSAIVNALCWTLYGKLPKDVNIDDVIKHGEKSCGVTVQLDDGTNISRTRYPNDLYFTKPDDNIPLRGKDARETQKLIETKLGITFNTFCEAIYFPQGVGFQFIQSTEEEKAKILSELQDLTIFDKARKAAHEKGKELEIEKIKITTKYDAAVRNVSLTKENHSKLCEMKLKFDQEKTNELEIQAKYIKELSHNVEQIKKEYQSLEYDAEAKVNLKKRVDSLSDHLRTVQKSSGTLAAKKSNLEVSLEHETEKLKDLENTKECPTCGGNLDKEKGPNNHIQQKRIAQSEKVEKLKKQYKAVIAEIKENGAEDVAAIEQEMFESRQLLDKANEKEMKFYVARNKLESAEKALLNSIEQRGRFERKTNADIIEKIAEFEDKVLKAESDVKQLDIILYQLNADIIRYQVLKDSFKEIKQYIFQSILDDLNTRANQYASELFEMPINVHFTNESIEGDVSKILCKITLDGNERSFGLLSGGQGKRVELAVNLALNDIISSRNGGRWDVRIFDEPFQNLSESSMAKAIGLFEKLKGKTILIEHNSIAQTIVNNIFEVEYRNGESREAQGLSTSSLSERQG